MFVQVRVNILKVWKCESVLHPRRTSCTLHFRCKRSEVAIKREKVGLNIYE